MCIILAFFRPFIEGKSPEVIKSEQSTMKSHKIRKILVRWKGYSAEHDTWEPEDNLTSCPGILQKYKKEHKLNGV